MKVFNVNKEIELNEYDLEKGYLKPDALEVNVPEQTAVEEVSHYEVIREYPSGGKDVKKVIDVEGKPYVPAHVTREEIQIYVPYTERELEIMSANSEIRELKQKLNATDYKAIKYAEGVLSEDEYSGTQAQRQAWRDRINELEMLVLKGEFD